MFLAAACGPEPRVSPSSAGKAPFDVDAIIRQVHFSWRPEPEGWRGGHSTYDVRATPRGLTLTPVRYNPPEPEAREVPAEVETGAPLFLGPARIVRGDERLSVDAPRGAVASDGHLTFEHGAVVEHLRNSEQGVEQSWSFERQPRGQGELRVRIPVEGLVHSGSTERGLHFADARTGFAITYGHGTWVDGKGRRTAVPAEYAHGHIQLRVPEEVLAGSEFPAVLDPLVSFEMIIDGRLVATDTAVRTSPALAFNGTEYLVVWRCTRANDTDIYGARVSSTGALLDPAGIAVGNGPGSASQPFVASNGKDFYVVWTQHTYTEWRILGTQVSAAGEVSPPGGRPVSLSSRSQSLPRVASNETEYLVAWHENTPDGFSDVFARRVSATGEVLDDTNLPIATGANYYETAPSVASNGTYYLVAWNDERSGSTRVYARRVSNKGEVLDGSGFALSGSSLQGNPTVASNGRNFLVAWLDYRTAPTRDLYATRVTEEGKIVDGQGLLIAGDPARQESFAAVSSDGNDYLVAWTAWSTTSSRYQNLASRVSATNPSETAVLDPVSLVLSPSGGTYRYPAVARAPSGYFVAWEGTSGSATQLYSAWVSKEGAVTEGNGFPVRTVPSLYQTEPAVASNGNNYLVVWTETGGGSNRIYGTRVSLEGGTIDLSGMEIGTEIRERQLPAVTSNGVDYFVTWMDYRNVNWDIYGARVLGEGPAASAVLDTSGIPISTHAAYEDVPTVASNRQDYFVTWRRDAGGNRGDVYGARVTSTGVVQDPLGIAIATNVVEHYTPRVASNGSNYLTVWSEPRTATSWDILGARVSMEGAVLDADSIAISSAPLEQFEPSVASDGTDYFVAWTDFRSGSNNDIYGTRVTGDGVVRDVSGLALCTDPVQQSSSRVVFDGTHYVAAWADYRWDTYWDVYVTQVTREGEVLTPDGFPVVFNARESEPGLSLASAGNQQSLIVFSRYDMEPEQGSRRVRGSFFSF